MVRFRRDFTQEFFGAAGAATTAEPTTPLPTTQPVTPPPPGELPPEPSTMVPGPTMPVPEIGSLPGEVEDNLAPGTYTLGQIEEITNIIDTLTPVTPPVVVTQPVIAPGTYYPSPGGGGGGGSFPSKEDEIVEEQAAEVVADPKWTLKRKIVTGIVVALIIYGGYKTWQYFKNK